MTKDWIGSWRRFGLAIVAIATIQVACAGAGSDRDQHLTEQLTMTCNGRVAASVANSPQNREIAFEVRIHTDDGNLLGLVDEESGRVQRLAYDAEISIGSIRFSDGVAQELMWTREKNNGGDFIGEAIRGDGQISALRISKANPISPDYDFVLFETESRSMSEGACR
jgi:hypothetical protein